MREFLNSKKGFTLIEVIIVIVIIAILAAILVPNLLTYIDSANEKNMMTAANTIRKTIMAEVAEMEKDGINVNGTETSNDVYDDDFWETISTSVNASVSEEDTATYIVTFKIEDNSLVDMQVTNEDKIAKLDGSYWRITDK